MLHMVIVNHSPESCPGRAGNEALVPCLNRMQELVGERGIKTVGRWVDPPAHVNFLLLDAPTAHAVQQVLMDSGLFAYTSTQVHAVVSMD